jgi:hypothetical protein
VTLFLLLAHAVCSALLWGAITHQALAVSWPGRSGASGWWASLRSVHAERYAQAVVVLFVLTAALGALLYPPFRVHVRADYLDAHAPWGTGLFEIKEHSAAIGLALLPLYGAAWRAPALTGARQPVTLFLAFVVWLNFVIGHVVNNLRGL